MKRRLLSVFASIVGLLVGAAAARAQEQLFPGRPGKVVTGELELPGLGRQTVEYTEIDGYKIFQGDIILSAPPEGRGRLGRQPETEERGGATIDSAVRNASHFQWSKGVVPYVIDAGFNSTMLTRIQNAINYWNTHSIIRLRPRMPTGDADWVMFTPGSGCGSPVGRQGGLQRTILGNCSQGSIIHEIGHDLGLFHENMRADRDMNVLVHWQNIPFDFRGDFLTYGELGQDGADFGAFDFDSIMMYGSFYFSGNGQPTLTRLDGSTFNAQRDHLSAGDLAGIRQLYYARTFNGWTDLTSLSTVIPKFSPALTSWGNGHLAMFMVADDNQMYVAASSDGVSWSGWQLVPGGGLFSSAPAATSRRTGSLDVVGKGLDDRFWINTYDGNNSPPWTGWRPIENGWFFYGPGIAAVGSNLVDVYGTGQDNQLWINSMQDGVFTGWSPLGGVLTEGPSASRGCFFFCWSAAAVRGLDNGIFTGLRFGGQFTGFSRIPGDISFMTGPASVERALAFAIGWDGQMYVTNSDNGPWTTWKPLFGEWFYGYNPTGVRWPSGKVFVVGIGSGFHFKMNTYDRGSF